MRQDEFGGPERDRLRALFRSPPPPPPRPAVSGQLLRRVPLADSRVGYLWVDARTGRIARGDPRPTHLPTSTTR